jgi:mannose-6-phosphate isomerase-like protein (cupin superfamily)
MRLDGIVQKGWGYENIFITNDEYCGKILHFNSGSKSSMHYHLNKKETWHCLSGTFVIKYICTNDAEMREKLFGPGSTWTNHRGIPHQVECIEEGDILEVSTPDDSLDNYRIIKGDSQR